MSDTFFLSKKITQAQVRSIIGKAGYDPTLYTYTALVDSDGILTQGPPMALSSLRFAAKKLHIQVEISGSTLAMVSGKGPAAGDAHGHGNGNGNGARAVETIYSIDFINDTSSTWTFAVFQTLPASPGLKSLSWKQSTVPRGGESGVQWSIDYQVAVLKYRQVGGKGVYKASQKLGTSLGEAWKVVFAEGAQQLQEAGSAAKGQVTVANESSELADIGLGMDGDVALVQPQVYSNAFANFEVTPTYWVAMFKDVVQGEVISGAQATEPLQVQFLNGKTSLTYRAWLEEGVLHFGLDHGQPGSGEAIQVSLEQLAQREHVMSSRLLTEAAR